MERLTQQEIKPHILFKESFCVKDFSSEYNSYKGNAYGLANTLMQPLFCVQNLKVKKWKDSISVVNFLSLVRAYPQL